MSWVRVDCDVPMDGRLVGSGHAWAWPAVVARAKAGDGRILMRECSPRVMAYLWGPSLEAWQAALDHLLEVGLLIVDGQTEREFFITAARKARPGTRLFHLRANGDGGQCSQPVLLRILEASPGR